MHQMQFPRVVVTHRRARVGVAGSDLAVAQVPPGVEHGRDEGMADGRARGGGVRQAGAMTLALTDTAAAVARYAGWLHRVAGEDHHVASPLGAWLLLALCGPAS